MTPPSLTDSRPAADKISREFASRLAALPPGQRVRAVILPAPLDESVRGEERVARLQAAKLAAEHHYAAIDRVLEAHGGRRLTGNNPLGFVVIDATPAAIAALCELPWVHAVLEDQAIRPVG